MTAPLDRPDETPELAEKRKMYVVVRGDLPPGLRAAQAGHAVAEVCLGLPNKADLWNTDEDGNYLITLEVDDIFALHDAHRLIVSNSIANRAFFEPDLGMEMTAFGCLPSPELNHVLSHLPLAYTKRRWASRFQRWIGLGPS